MATAYVDHGSARMTSVDHEGSATLVRWPWPKARTAACMPLSQTASALVKFRGLGETVAVEMGLQWAHPSQTILLLDIQRTSM